MVKVLADTREKTPWSFSKSKFVDEVVVKGLKTGDYTIEGYENILAIERKASTSEIATNITESRWPDVLTRLSAYQYKYIICEFSLHNVLEFPINSGIPYSKQKFVKISPQFILKSLTDIQVMYGIPVIFAGDRICAEAYADSVFKRVLENEKS